MEVPITKEIEINDSTLVITVQEGDDKMKAKDVGYVSETLGNIAEQINNLVGGDKLGGADELSSILIKTRDNLKKIKDKLDNVEIEVRITKI